MNKALDVIDALGGYDDVARMVGVGYTAVVNWKSANRFPSDTYVLMQDELKLRGRAAPAHLWGMRSLQPIRIRKRRAG